MRRVSAKVQLEIRGAERLSFREKQVVTLKEMGKSQEEISKQLGISPSTVATLYHRARGKGYQVVVVIPGEALQVFGDNEEDG